MRKKKKEQSTFTMEEISSKLPTDVMEEILSRLPVKSLMRFRCVSKEWQNLLTDASFIVKHMERSTEKNPYPTHILEAKRGCLYSSKIESYRTTTTTKMMKGERGKQQHQLVVKDWGFLWPYIKIEASCDGLVCLSSILSPRSHHFSAALFNPATREFLVLPQKKRASKRIQPDSYYGLGVNPITKQYKVVRITYPSGTASVTLYAVGDGSHEWRHICDPFPYDVGFERYTTSICVGGFVLWLAIRSTADKDFLLPEPESELGMPCRYVILSFDLHQEVFQELPPLPFYQPDMLLCLGHLGECLSMSTSLPMEDSIELWVMKEYGVKESWTKVFKMKSRVSETVNIRFVSSRGFFKDGHEILLMTAGTEPSLYNPILYNTETQKMIKTRSEDFEMDGPLRFYVFASFVETLVSLKGEKEVRVKRQIKR